MSKFKTTEDYFVFSKRLVVIPTDDMLKLFDKYKIKLPLYVHTFLLRETIRDKVFEEKVYETYSDELKFRLRGYDKYSIFPYEKLIKKYNLNFELSRYKELLFDFIFANKNQIKFKNNFISDLEQLQHNYTVDLETMEYTEFFEKMKQIFYPEMGYLDGVKLSDWNEELLTSYTLGDLKALGKKYDVTIPRRINKSKLISILTAKFNLTDDESLLLTKKSVLDLELYAKEKGFFISIDLKKKDMIEYLKFALDMYHKTQKEDEFNYDIPLANKQEEVVNDLEEVEFKDEVESASVEESILIPVEEDVENQPKITIQEEKEPVKPEIETEKEPLEKKKSVEKTSTEINRQFEKPKSSQDQKELLEAKTLFSTEEKELLDEKINQIIKKYYKKRRKKRIIWGILIALIIIVVGLLGYSYYIYHTTNSLPFGIPVFW